MRKIARGLLTFAAVMSPLIARGQESVSGSNPLRPDSVALPPADPPATAPRAWFGSELGLLRWPQLTGDWAGGRTALAGRGIEFSLTLTQDASANVRGGVQRGSAARGLLVAQVNVDLARLAGFRGTTASVSYAGLRGTNGSDLSGDIQAFSSIDAEPFTHLFEAWVEQAIGGAVRLKVGLVDANSEFAVVGAAGDFINASAGVSPTIVGIPTYPEPRMSANVFVQPAPWLAFSAGMYDGTFGTASDGTTTVRDRFSIVEMGGSWQRLGRLGAGRAGAGLWHHSGMAEQLDGGFVKGAAGWWATIEQRVAGADATDDRPATGVQVFAKYGAAPEVLSVVREHLMAGLVRDGGLRAGSDDALGLAVTHVNLSNVPAANTPLNETSLEMFYRISVAGFITVRPDVQFVMRPSGDPGLRNALVATLRTAITF